jgi:hypothetical protein
MEFVLLSNPATRRYPEKTWEILKHSLIHWSDENRTSQNIQQDQVTIGITCKYFCVKIKMAIGFQGLILPQPVIKSFHSSG